MSSDGGQAPLRVVVADDETSVREVLRLSLDIEEDFAVVGEAADGSEALAITETEQPDILVLDLRMPGVGGLDALPLIRERAPHTQIVILSALPEAEMGRETLTRGADAYLEKSRAVTDLAGWLRTLRLGWVAARAVEESDAGTVSPPAPDR